MSAAEGAGRPRPRPDRLVLAGAIATAVLLLAVAVGSGWHVLHSTEFFTALAARKYVWANAALVLGVGAVALLGGRLLGGRVRWLAVLGPGLMLAGVLVASGIPGGQWLGIVSAVLTMAAVWDTGERLLRALGSPALARLVPVAWLTGICVWSLSTLVLGWLALVSWWNLGVLVVVFGAIGLRRLAMRALAARHAIAEEVGSSALSLTCAGVTVATTAWAAIYTAAPELQYDALYGKAYLPKLWAQTGRIESIPAHVQFGIAGWFQLLATYGHILGSESVGRYMQLLALPAAAAMVWWWGRRHGALGPIAAVAVAITPHLFWQASTADDDLLLALAAFAFCLAVVESMRLADGLSFPGTALAIGLLAGAGPSMKLHLIPLFGLLLVGWIVAARKLGTVLTRFAYASLGAATTALPPLVARWIETGNPVLPAYNNVFRSKYWLPINENADFPFWPKAGTFGPVKAIWQSALDPSLMVPDAPPGAFGFLIGAVLCAVLLGWRARRSSSAKGMFVVWLALVPALVLWYTTFRYLRYLLPIAFVSVALVLAVAGRVRLTTRWRGIALGAVVLAGAASFPIAIAQYWNVPGHKPPVYAAIGKWSPSSYEDDAFAERPAMLAFNRLAPAHSLMASETFERVWLTGGRDLDNLDYEVVPRMELHGPLPTNGNQALTDLRAIGIQWALVTGNSLLQHQPGYLSEVLTTHGQVEFAARGWDLFHLVPAPPVPAPTQACDRSAVAVPACWGGPRLPGGGLNVSVTRLVPVCAGQTVVVRIAQPAGGGAVPVAITFPGSNPELGVQPGQGLPGTEQLVYATPPQGATQAEVVVGTAIGASISKLHIEHIGPTCHTAGERRGATLTGG